MTSLHIQSFSATHHEADALGFPRGIPRNRLDLVYNRRGMFNRTQEFISGGTAEFACEQLYVAYGLSCSYNGTEHRIIKVLDRGRIGDLPVAKCQIVSLVGVSQVHTVYVVAPGLGISGYVEERLGELVRDCEDPDVFQVTSPAFLSAPVDTLMYTYEYSWHWALLPCEFVIKGFCFIFWWLMAYAIPFRVTSLSRIPLSPYGYWVLICWVYSATIGLFYDYDLRVREVVISAEILKYMYRERFNTLTALGSRQAKQLVLSSTQKKFPHISQQTIYSTVCIFNDDIIREFSESTINNPSGNILTDMGSIPRLFELEVAALESAPGFVDSTAAVSIPTFVNNNKLTLLKGSGVTFVDGLLTFEDAYDKPVPVYFYGPHVASAAVKYTVKSTTNITSALTRMTGARVDELIYRKNQDMVIMRILGYGQRDGTPHRDIAIFTKAFTTWGVNHVDFKKNWRGFSPKVRITLNRIKTKMNRYLKSVFEDMDPIELNRVKNLPLIDLSTSYADEPHLKRLPRQLCIQEKNSLPYLWDKPPTKVDGKVKWETAKHSKAARLFISLGDHATLYYPDLPRFFKESMDKDIIEYWPHGGHIGSSLTRFVKENSQETMDEWAQSLYSFHTGQSPYYDLFYLHSDDSHFCTMVLIRGKLHYLSVDADIKKCDLSHGPGLFALLMVYIKSCGFDMEKVKPLFQQLMSNILVKHPNNKSDDFALFAVNEITLFSGHTLTTLQNNFACLCIGMAFRAILTPEHDFDSLEQILSLLIEGAMLVGYDISLDTVTCTPDGSEPDLSKITFLKHFPARTRCGSVVAYKCLSTLIRGLGISDEECIGKTRVQEIVRGWGTSHQSTILHTINNCVGCHMVLPLSPYIVEDHEFEARYGKQIHELLEGVEMLFRPTSVVLVAHPALDAILDVGYGLPRVGD